MRMIQGSDFIRGIRSGIPVFIGYFTASIAFGLLAVTAGLQVWEAVLFSMVSTTGAGQFMSVNMILHGVSPVEAVFSVALMNLRYSLMSMSLTLKIDFPSLKHRFMAAHCITDENFSIISAREGKASISFVYGVQLIAFAGWVGGTLAGALGGSVLPPSFQEATGIALYALFVSLLIPDVKKDKRNLLIALLAGGLNSFFVLQLHWPMGWSFVGAMILAAVGGSLVVRVESPQEAAA